MRPREPQSKGALRSVNKPNRSRIGRAICHAARECPRKFGAMRQVEIIANRKSDKNRPRCRCSNSAKTMNAIIRAVTDGTAAGCRPECGWN